MLAKITSIFLILVANSIFGTSSVFADEPKQLGHFFDMAEKVFSKIMPIAGLLCVIFIIQGGYMWMTSSGDPAKIQQAQGTLTWAIIGLIFVILSSSILSAIIKAIE
ncbi:MAG: pilin [Candidatus Dojkabacteria bacterium]|jgi:hypothetical protein